MSEPAKEYKLLKFALGTRPKEIETALNQMVGWSLREVVPTSKQILFVFERNRGELV